MAGFSIVEYFGEQGGHRCGYCGNSSTSESHGMWAHKLTCQDYQDLIDRGWRRSGKYVYKPQLNKTCCPQYPIRCDALQFKISKSQKKVLKKMTHFLTVPETEKAASGNDTMVVKTGPISAANTEQIPRQQGTESKINKAKQVCKTTPAPGTGKDPNRPPCRKAKQIRLERKQQKLANQQGAPSVSDKKPVVQEAKGPAVKSLEDFMVECLPDKDPLHKLEIRLVQSDLGVQEFSESFEESATVYFKYQQEIHKDPPEKCTNKRVKVVHVDMESPGFKEYFRESHKLFEKYQIAIHKDFECGIRQYKRFLVDSPLVHSKGPGAPSEGYGSFHQQYYLDGKLIAVGVLDILPSCVSSVYFFYDPDYSFLSLGVYSALRELSFTRTLHQQSPRLKFYYMGFYIHSCPKMRYKGQYFPSYLVCPETYEWVPINQCVQKLDASKYSRLSENLEDPPMTGVESVMVLHQQEAMSYQMFKVIKGLQGTNESDPEVDEYAKFVGPLVAPRMLLYRS